LDLVKKGNDGLLLALKTFTGDAHTTFSVQAAACVNASIAKAVEESAPTQE